MENELDIKKINFEIIESLREKKAVSSNSAVFPENLKLDYDKKIIYYLIEEYVKAGFIHVIDNGKIFFDEKKYRREQILTQTIYFLILLVPFIVALVLIMI